MEGVGFGVNEAFSFLVRTCFCAIVVYRAVLNSVVIIESLVLVDVSRPVLFDFTEGGERGVLPVFSVWRWSAIL